MGTWCGAECVASRAGRSFLYGEDLVAFSPSDWIAVTVHTITACVLLPIRPNLDS
jgi:hypothetical protein